MTFANHFRVGFDFTPEALPDNRRQPEPVANELRHSLPSDSKSKIRRVLFQPKLGLKCKVGAFKDIAKT